MATIDEKSVNPLDNHMQYNNPNDVKSTIDGSNSEQVITYTVIKKALIEAAKKSYFGQFSDTKSIPRNSGKAIKQYIYLNILDDRNSTNQGLDANGAYYDHGNLYGSSKDTGNIVSKLPMLGEKGGPVNRVGMTRLLTDGSLHTLGIHTTYTQSALDYDSDPAYKAIMKGQLLEAGAEIVEAQLQADLLSSATTILYAGGATKDSELTGEGDNPSVLDVNLFYRLSQILVDNRVPKTNTLIKGSSLIDTKTVSGGWFMAIGNELLPTLYSLKNSFGQPAFIPVQQYAAATTVANGEVGAIGDFRLVVVPEMQHFAGKGATVTQNKGYYATETNYNVFPLFVVGPESFSHLSFAGHSSTNSRFTITERLPHENAHVGEPYGQIGFISLRWHYGILVQRPERLAMIKCVVKQA